MLEVAGVMFPALHNLHSEWPAVGDPYVSLWTVQQVACQLNVNAISFDTCV